MKNVIGVTQYEDNGIWEAMFNTPCPKGLKGYPIGKGKTELAAAENLIRAANFESKTDYNVFDFKIECWTREKGFYFLDMEEIKDAANWLE